MKHAILLMALTACLDPLVEDRPGASSHLLPEGAAVPSALDNPDLTTQLALNDGIDDRAYATAGRITRARGASADAAVSYWSFGPATRAPSPLYQLYDAAGPLADHPPWVDALPGDPGYGAVHTLVRVDVTAAYRGEQITSVEAMSDALDLGLIEVPVPLGVFVASPLVLPGTKLAVSDDPADYVIAATVFGRGHAIGLFRFGGDRGVQPGSQLLPTNQVSLVRTAKGGSYDASKPIFQAQIPAAPAAGQVTYTPLSVVVNVDVTDDSLAGINRDSDLFTRNANGQITGTTDRVKTFAVTTTLVLWQLQFAEGAP